ncbi:MAG: hypothetical protein ACK5JH_06460 [Anaerocolumna sp.]
MVKYRVKIIKIKEESKGTVTYLLEKPRDFTWLAGAHTHIGLVGFDAGEKPNKDLVRHMSIMTLPEENCIGFTTKFTAEPSEFKERLGKLGVGDEIIIFKIGCRMALRREYKKIVLLSMGVGIATMRPLVLDYKKNGSGIKSLVSINVNSTKDYLYKDELDGMMDDSYCNFWVDSRKTFYEELEKASTEGDGIYYLVGSYEFLLEVIAFLGKKGIEQDSIVIDKPEIQLPHYFDELIKHKH